MLPNLNPFSNSKTIPYHQVSREFSENDSDRGHSSSDSTIAQKESYPDEDDYLTAKSFHRPHRAWLRHICCYILVAVVSVLTGLVLGEIFRVEYEVDGYLAPFGNPNRVIKDVVWHENKTFADEPSAITEKAWKRLIPEGRGFISHPVITKGELMSVSVFHEIHCLHMIRTAYFTSDYLYRRQQHNHPSLLSRSPTVSTDPNFTPNPYLESTLAHPAAHGLEPDHIKHCFDYLRQALMCAADTNLEEVKVEDGFEGASGWGSKRMCRDFKGVWKWSKKWRTGNGTGIE